MYVAPDPERRTARSSAAEETAERSRFSSEAVPAIFAPIEGGTMMRRETLHGVPRTFLIIIS